MITPTDAWLFLLVFCSVVAFLTGWTLGRRYTRAEAAAMAISEEDVERLVRAFIDGPYGTALDETINDARSPKSRMAESADEALGLN